MNNYNNYFGTYKGQWSVSNTAEALSDAAGYEGPSRFINSYIFARGPLPTKSLRLSNLDIFKTSLYKLTIYL